MSRTYGTLRYGQPRHTGFGSTRSGASRGHDRAQWLIQCEPQVSMMAKRIFGRVRMARGGVIQLTDTNEVARNLEWFLERYPMVMDDVTREKLTMGADARRREEDAVQRILSGQVAPLLTEPARQPRDYQLAPAEMVQATGRLLLTDDVGLGKTQSALMLLAKPEALPALVVTLNGVMLKQWIKELHEVWPWLTGHVARKATPYDPTKLRGVHAQPDVLVMNYTKLAGWADHLRGEIRTVIFDEMQELRRADTRKYEAAAAIADAATYVMGATNTPVWNYGGEMYNIVSVLDGDALGTREEFVREWGGGESYGDFSKVGVSDPKALGAYLTEMGIMYGRTRAQVGRELPEAIVIEHAVDSDPKALENVSSSLKELATTLLTSGDRTERFQAAGDLDWQLREATGVGKAPFVAEFVRLLLESEKKVVLFGWHHAVYAIWGELLADVGIEMIHGRTSTPQKNEAVRRFLEDDTCRVLAMSVRAGVGIDGLQNVARVCVFGELDWSPQPHRQAIGRLRRDRRDGLPDEPVVAYFLHTEVGSDPHMMATLDVKKMQADPMVRPEEDHEIAAKVDNSQRMRDLAESYLRQAGELVPELGATAAPDLSAFPAEAFETTEPRPDDALRLFD